ncbi:unnamed protein product [Paramecium octaurelia]|uniref:WD-40 repeat protein n=1 Tax=Paramecium octaurelia TaxID=43137 RepID=A0A8S1W5Y8_PAROT|nr:unnamed protein product [Paramecium octaurelia]
MHHEKEQADVLYEVLSFSNEVDEVFLPILINILKKERIQDCLKFLSQEQNKFLLEIEGQKVENQSLLEKEQTLNGEKNIKIITDVLKKVMDHDFNTQNYSMDDYEEFKKDLITKVSMNKKIIEFLKFLVHLTALDETYIQCGSNSLHLLLLMKVDLREQSFENIRIRNTSLDGGNFVRCIFNGSEFDNVSISGMNLNQAQMFNCNWKNIKIHELNKLDGHSRRVNQVCFSPDGKSLASCGDDNKIILWDVKTGKIKSKIKVKEVVKSVCFSHNASTLAFSSGRFENKKQYQMVILKQLSICYSPDGTTLASGSRDNSIRLWDIKTGQQKAKLDGHSSRVNSICYSPDGTTLASGSWDNSIRLWDVQTGQQKAQLVGHSNAVLSICYSPDGNTLASGSSDNSIRLWNVKTSKEILQSDSNYKDLLAQFNIPLQNGSQLPSVNPYCTILKICQNPLFEASGTLILQGQFMNYQGIDLKPLFKSMGSCFLEDLKHN